MIQNLSEIHVAFCKQQGIQMGRIEDSLIAQYLIMEKK